MQSTLQWKENVLIMKILQAISRTTGPNIGMFVLIFNQKKVDVVVLTPLVTRWSRVKYWGKTYGKQCLMIIDNR